MSFVRDLDTDDTAPLRDNFKCDRRAATVAVSHRTFDFAQHIGGDQIGGQRCHRSGADAEGSGDLCSCGPTGAADVFEHLLAQGPGFLAGMCK